MDSFNIESNDSVRFCLLIKLSIFLTSLLLAWTVQAQVTFENTTDSIGGPFHEGESWGASWGHLDNDVYPDLFVNNHAMKNSLLRNNGDGTFSERVDTADLSGIMAAEPNADTHGGAWADYDNDGDQDLFITRSSRGSRLYLFENNGQAQFTERGGNEGVNAVGGGRMATLFDFNNDGRLDLAAGGNEGNDLFRWNGNSFTDVGNATGVAGTCLRGSHSLASDFFGTGLIFLCSSTSAVVETAFDTRGGATPFTDVSDKFDHFGAVPDVVLGDFNNDLKMDMFGLRGIIRPVSVGKVSNNRIEAWISRGGTEDYFANFSFTSAGPITIDVSARNVNKNKRETIFIGDSGYHPSSVPFTLSPNDNVNHGSAYAPEYRKYGLHVDYDQNSQTWTVTISGGGQGASEGAFIKISGNGFSEPVVNGLIVMDSAAAPKFLINNGSRLTLSNSRGIGNVQCGSIAAADFDNDMDIDLYLACRNSVENTENRLYLNDGTGQFSYASNTGGEGLLGMGIDSGAGTAESVVTADYDIDGFIDLFVTNGNRLFPHFIQDGYTAGGPDQFYRNTTNNNNKWLLLDLQGVTSNRDGFGAKVIVTAGGVSQLREQNGKIHRWSHDHKRLHFGLANNSTANIRIEWPNGDVDIHNGVSPNKLYNAVQDGALIDITPSGNNNSSLSINSTTTLEGSTAQLTVSRSSAGNAVSVDYQTIAQSAVAGTDYIAKSGTLNFASNATSKSISVETITDSLVEGTEVFSVVLSNPVGTNIDHGVGNVEITDSTSGGGSCGQPNYSATQINDRGLYIWQDCANPNKWSIGVSVGGGSWTVFDGTVDSNLAIGTVETSGFESSDSFELLDSDRELNFLMGVASAGQDGLTYIASSGADLCLSLDNNLPIFYGANAVSVSSPVNLKDISNTCGSGGSLPETSINSISEVEGGTANLTVNLTSTGSVVSVDYATIAQTATSGADYVAKSGTLNFTSSQSSKTISIETLTDGVIEGDENFTIALSNPVGATISQGNGTVTITDATTGGGGGDCGAPSYDTAQSSDKGLYVWQDCADLDKWSIRVNAGGGAWTTYNGDVSSNSTIGSVSTVSFENSDSFQLLNSNQTLNFFMGTANRGEDGLDYTAAGSDLCLTVNSNQPIFYGVNAVSVSSPLNLRDITLACGDAPVVNESAACGMPSISASNEAAMFVWKDCGNTDLWSFRATAGGGSSITYTGSIDSGSAITSLDTFSYEGIDAAELSNTDQTLEFIMKMSGNGQDGISFDLGSSTSSCLDIQSTTSVPVLLGSQKTAISPPFDLVDLDSC